MARYLTRPEAADKIRTTVSTLNYWAWKGIGPEYIRVGRKVLYPEDKLDAFLDARTVKARETGGAA